MVVDTLLPCAHDPSAVKQIDPTIHLLKHLDSKCPKVLKREGVVPPDYHGKKVFRSAVESIRGEYIASAMTQRQQMVADVFEGLKGQGKIADYEGPFGRRQRYDFLVFFSLQPRVSAAVEVKGGEGNSINISERPAWAEEFVVWCHLDGAIKNEPSHGAGAIVFNRIADRLVKERKVVDALFIKDALCGSGLRPCPKYPRGIDPGQIAPDIFLFPRAVPTRQNPKPKVHTLRTLHLPKLILDYFRVKTIDIQKHLWDVHIELSDQGKRGSVRWRRKMWVVHQGQVVAERYARA